MNATVSMARESTPRLLVIDADPADRAAVKKALAGIGHLDEVDDVAAALRAVSEARYDLVLLDFFIVPENGLAVLDKLRSAQPGLAAIFLSSADGAEPGADDLLPGGEDYLPKSALGDAPRFRRLVRAALQGGQLRRETERGQARLKLAAEALGMGTWSFDTTTRRFQGGSTFAALIGLPTAESWPEQALLDLLPPEQRSMLVSALDGGNVGLWLGPLGSRWISLRGRSEGGDRLFGIALDVSVQKEADDRAAWMRDQLMGIASHDLRNPLSAVRSASALLAKSEKLSDSERKLVNIIRNSSERMTNLIVQLLDLTRVRLGGGLSLERRQVPLADVVRAVIEELKLVHPDREVVQRLADVTADADGDRFGQVVSNLIGNAMKHSDGRSAITVELGGADGGTFSVHNFGKPISKADQQLIFEPFVQLGDKSTRDGLGLGLHISREIMRAHGGSLTVESSAEGGTRFVARFA